MKHKNHVTEAVLAANRANSKLSPGPTTEQGKARSSCNALRHGILARKIDFEDRAHSRAYRAIRKTWRRQFHPHGRLERFLVEEIALISWKLGIVEALEVEDLLRREHVGDGIDRLFHEDLELPLSDGALPIDRGWDCERVEVHAEADKDSKNIDGTRTPIVLNNQVVNGTQSAHSVDHQSVGRLELHAVMGSRLDTIDPLSCNAKARSIPSDRSATKCPKGGTPGRNGGCLR